MTTLTPETALERLVVHTAMEDAAVAMECEAALKPLLAALSTERQARESTQFLLADRSTELDWERSARQAAEKEVERLRVAILGGEDAPGLAMSLTEGDVLNALADNYPLPRERAEAAQATADALARALRSADYAFTHGMFNHRADNAREIIRQALSALPPPVPAEEAQPGGWIEDVSSAPEGVQVWGWRHDGPPKPIHLYGFVELVRREDGAWFDDQGESIVPPRLWQPAIVPKAPISRAWTGQPISADQAEAYDAYRDMQRDQAEASTQAPQDVAGLVEGDLDWLSKVLDGHRVPYRDVLTGDGGLYCIGKAFEKERVDARIDRILSALRPSPISHETKALVLAAADAAAEGSTAIAPVENGERGSVQILCEEIGFPFSPDLERPEVLVRFVGELIVEIEHHASIRSAVAKALGKETEAGPEDEVLAMAVQMIAAPDNRSRIATAMALHGLCDERNPEDAYPTNHTIDMLSSCASAIRFGLEPRVQGIGSRHAAEAASHVWRQVYGIKLFDQHTGGWSKSWARHKLEVATGRLVAGESVNGPVPVGASAAATNNALQSPQEGKAS